MSNYQITQSGKVYQLKEQIQKEYNLLRTPGMHSDDMMIIYDRIHNLQTKLQAAKDRVTYANRYPAHMPCHNNTQAIMNSIR